MAQNRKRRQAALRKLKLQDTFRLSARGLGKVLGDLEVRVMRAVWTLGRPATARAIHERVAATHDVHVLTVTTVLNKLVEKGLLARGKRDDLFHYEAVWSEDELTAHASRRVMEGVLALGPGVLATSLVDVLADYDPEQLAQLGRLIHERMRDQSREPEETPMRAARGASGRRGPSGTR